MISQQTRQYYLQNLGIDSYFPRNQLPGAAVSPIYADQNEFFDDADVESTTRSQAEQSARISIENLDGDVENAIKPSSDKQAKASSVAKVPIDFDVGAKPRLANIGSTLVSAQNNKAVVHHFSLAVWRLSSKLMIVDSRNSRLALPTTTLLANILMAIGYADPLPKFDTVRWPLASDRSRNTSSSEEEARGFFQAYLQAQFEKRPSEIVLLMGAHAARYGLSSEQWSDAGEDPKKEADLLGKVFDLSTSQKAIVVPSLAAMLRKPELKAITWQAIKSLRTP
ncbi:uracil-DNA glycosylase family protein [Aurantivibrio infirmus]